MGTVLSVAEAMLAELKLAPQDWPSVLSTISPVLIEAVLECLGRNDEGRVRSPLRMMAG